MNDWRLGNCEEELPKKPVGRLSVNCRPSVDRQVTDSLPTANQQVTDRLRKKKNCCSMANAFHLAGCLRSTVRDFVAIAELKIVDHREHERVIRDHVGSVKELEVTCRKRLRRYLPVMANLRREGKLLPLKFDERFYE